MGWKDNEGSGEGAEEGLDDVEGLSDGSADGSKDTVGARVCVTVGAVDGSDDGEVNVEGDRDGEGLFVIETPSTKKSTPAAGPSKSSSASRNSYPGEKVYCVLTRIHSPFGKVSVV